MWPHTGRYNIMVEETGSCGSHNVSGFVVYQHFTASSLTESLYHKRSRSAWFTRGCSSYFGRFWTQYFSLTIEGLPGVAPGRWRQSCWSLVNHFCSLVETWELFLQYFSWSRRIMENEFIVSAIKWHESLRAVERDVETLECLFKQLQKYITIIKEVYSAEVKKELGH